MVLQHLTGWGSWHIKWPSPSLLCIPCASAIWCTASQCRARRRPCCVCLVFAATGRRQTDRQTASKPLLQLTPVQRKRRKLLIYHCIQCLLSTLCITYSSKNCLALQALLYLRLQIMCGMRARAQAVQISTWGDFDLWQRPFN